LVFGNKYIILIYNGYMNTECYRFEKIQYDDGFLSSGVDATYIIHLEGNGRLPEIQKQLEEYHPTNTVYIVYNKGYKKCKKQDYITNSARDLVDANLQIFKHAELHGYGNILVLEDDFIFSKNIKDKKHQENVLRFLNKNKDRPFIYLIGCVPYYLLPYDYYNYRGVLTAGMHCVVYNEFIRKCVLQDDQKYILDWDAYFNTLNNKYVYYLPMSYQLFPETENSKSWGKECGHFTEMLSAVSFYIYSTLNMDKEPEPGFTFFYFFSKIAMAVVFILIVCLVYVIYKSLRVGKSNKPIKKYFGF